MNIRPVSDLRNHFPDVERDVIENGPVFLTKNGYGTMVVMSIDQFDYINGTVESALDVADTQAASMTVRLSHAEVFGAVRKGLADA